VEHFWCAPYLDLLNKYCRETVLDLHNVESVLHDRCAMVSYGMGSLTAAGHRRFGAASRKLESALIPRYSRVLAASEEDARSVRAIAPGAKAEVYPNAIPWVELPRVAEQPCVVFSGNFEYHPNIDAVRFLIGEIWPGVRKARPDIRLRLVGRGDSFIRHLLPGDAMRDNGIEVTGPVEDALAEIGRAQVVVAPVRTGSGTRIKILEAWAAGLPVVSTPVGAEGLHARDEAHLLLAEGAAAFARQVTRLLACKDMRIQLGMAGRLLLEKEFTWEKAWQRLDF